MIWLVLMLCLAGSLTAWFAWPRRVELREFNPAEMADRDARMWRNYYEKRYPALLLDLYMLARRQFGFSPLDCLRLGTHAALAAKRFQPSTSRQQAQTAIPNLERYYRIIATRTGSPLDAAHTARLELEWWQMRREKATAEQVGLTMAHIAGQVYGVPAEVLLESSHLRAEAMAYRDARDGGAMTDKDWQYVRDRLRKAYSSAHSAVSRSARL